MAVENPSDRRDSTGSDEIDLRSLFEAIGNFFKRIFISFIRLILYIRSRVWRYKAVIAALAVLGGIGGYIYSTIASPFYKTTMVINSQYFRGNLMISAIENLDGLCSENNYSVLAEKLSLPEVEARKIKSFALDVIVSEAERMVVMDMMSQIDPAENPNLYESLRQRISPDAQTTYKITAEVYDNSVVPLLDSAILSFMQSNQFIQKRVKISEITLLNKEKQLVTELARLDSLKDLVTLNYANMARDLEEGNNNVYVGRGEDGGLVKPVELYREYLRLYEELQGVRRNLYLQADNEIIDSFTIDNRIQGDGPVKTAAYGCALGFLLGLAFGMLRDFNQYLSRVEESEKLAA